MKRLKDTQTIDHSTEALAAALLRRGDPGPWTAPLPARRAPRARWRGRASRRWWAGLLFVFLGGSVAVASYLWLAPRPPEPVSLPRPPPAEAPPVAEPPLDEPPTSAPPPPPSIVRPMTRKVLPSPKRTQEPVPAVPPVSPTVEPDVPTEADLIQRAVHALRVEKSKERTQQALLRYRQQFPQGVLREEAHRLENELRLSFEQVAPLSPQALAASSSTIDWEAALFWVEVQLGQPSGSDLSSMFEVLVQKRGDPALRERTLYAATIWALQQGEYPKAKAWAQSYLTEFPQGRFAQAMAPVARGK